MSAHELRRFIEALKSDAELSALSRSIDPEPRSIASFASTKGFAVEPQDFSVFELEPDDQVLEWLATGTATFNTCRCTPASSLPCGEPKNIPRTAGKVL